MSESSITGSAMIEKELKPIVFVNKPINDYDKDVIGFAPLKANIDMAIQSNANMIGIIADFGTGKSSLTEILSNNTDKYSGAIKINMWDSLYENSNKECKSTSVSDLTKSFLYQLASGCADKKGKSKLASNINKRLSRNYGIISFSTASGKIWPYLVFSALSYALFLGLKESKIAYLMTLLNSAYWANFLICISPIFFVGAILSLVLGVKETTIAYSHWKNNTPREPEINDVFDIYNDIAITLCNNCKTKKQLVIIEDLDRIGDKCVVVGLLREIYRFQNLLNDQMKNKLVFIIAVRPEAQLSYGTKTSQKDDEIVYSKLFDYTVNLKPIHFQDYESILLSIINSNTYEKEKLREEKIITLDGRLPDHFYWIMQGANLTIRNLKDRLNQSLSLYVSLKNKQYQNNPSINFGTCAAVTYLESQYPLEYYKLIKSESQFAEAIRSSYSIRNNGESTTSQENDLIQVMYKMNIDQPNGVMYKDLAKMIVRSTIDEDFRMYFYSYPKNSHISTSDEKDISNLLLLPQDNESDTELDDKVKRILQNPEYNIIVVSLERINNDNIGYPPIVLQNEYIFAEALKINLDRILELSIEQINWDSNKMKSCSSLITEIYGYKFDTKNTFFTSYAERLKTLFEKFKESKIVSVRKELINILGDDIVWVKCLFFDDEIVESNVPIITVAEILKIRSIGTAIELIETDKIDDSNISYISDKLNSEKLIESTYKSVLSIYRAAISTVTSSELAKYLLTFLTINEKEEEDIFEIITNETENIDDGLNKIAEYITLLDADSLSIAYLKKIDLLKIHSGLTDVLLSRLENNDLYLTYFCSLSTQDRMNEIDFSLERVSKLTLSNAENLMSSNPDVVIKIRGAILRNHIQAIEQYIDLFMGIYPLIDIHELNYFSDFSDSLCYVDGSKLTKENSSFLCDYFNAAYRNPEECYGIFCIFSDEYEGNATNEETANYIISNIDYKKINFRGMPIEKKEEVTQNISSAMKFDNAQSCIAFMHMTNTLIPSLETIIINERWSEEYIILINEIDCPTEETIRWLSNHYTEFALSPNITKELLGKGFWAAYLYGKTLYDGELNFDPNLIPSSIYVDAYISNDSMFEIMKKNITFKQFIMDNKLFVGFNKQRLEPLFKLRQPFYFVKYMFEHLEGEEIEDYLENIPHLDTEEDSKDFLQYVKSPEISIKLNSKKSRYFAKERIWSSGDRQSFTKFMNKLYPD